jgi:hypothetical protein
MSCVSVVASRDKSIVAEQKEISMSTQTGVEGGSNSPSAGIVDAKLPRRARSTSKVPADES